MNHVVPQRLTFGPFLFKIYIFDFLHQNIIIAHRFRSVLIEPSILTLTILKRTLCKVYYNQKSNFQQLLTKDKSVTIYHQRIERLLHSIQFCTKAVRNIKNLRKKAFIEKGEELRSTNLKLIACKRPCILD